MKRFHKQICTFPFALHSTPTFNAKAYPVKMDAGYSKPCYWIVWSPIHYPHYVGKFGKEENAAKKANEINAQKEKWVYVECLPNKNEIYNKLDA